jgi:hypothetical protein
MDCKEQKRWLNSFKTSLFMLCLFFNCEVVAATQSDSQHWEEWPTVGEAQLTWFLFDVYESRLHSPSGGYIVSSDVTPHPVALEIRYQRSISNLQLLDATIEQWQALGYDSKLQKQWLDELMPIFPSVSSGDKLIYVTNGISGDFYFDKNDQQNHIGKIESEQLNDAFLAIWLSPNTEYPELREQLIGLVE